jgi:hypothetical protein
MEYTSEKSASNGSVKSLLFSALGLVEVKAILLMLAFSSIAFFTKPDFFDWNVQIINKFYKEKAKLTVQEVINSEQGVAEPIKVIEFGNQADEFYSFKYTSLGFFTRSLDFLEEVSKKDAEGKLVELLPPTLARNAKNYLRAVLIICEKYQVDPLWVVSVMWTESHFKPFAKSHVGASGLMQVMPDTRKYLYRDLRRSGKFLLVEQDDFNIQDYFNFDISSHEFKKYVMKLVNIEIGVLYLKRLLKSFNYNHRYATVAYNMGPGWTSKRLRRNLPVGDDNLYLDKVMRAYKFLVRRI